MTQEGGIQTAIIYYLESTGWLTIRFNNVGMYDPTKKLYRKNVNIQGISDIIALKGGTFLCVEVKKPSEMTGVGKIESGLKQPKSKRDWRFWHQNEFIKNVRNHGGIGFFADSVDMVRNNLPR